MEHSSTEKNAASNALEDYFSEMLAPIDEEPLANPIQLNSNELPGEVLLADDSENLQPKQMLNGAQDVNKDTHHFNGNHLDAHASKLDQASAMNSTVAPIDLASAPLSSASSVAALKKQQSDAIPQLSSRNLDVDNITSANGTSSFSKTMPLNSPTHDVSRSTKQAKQAAERDEPVLKPSSEAKRDAREFDDAQQWLSQLEEAKRQRLQQMLSAQTIAKVHPKQKTEAPTVSSDVQPQVEQGIRVQAPKTETQVEVSLAPKPRDQRVNEPQTLRQASQPETQVQEAAVVEQKNADTSISLTSNKAEVEEETDPLLNWSENGRPVWAQTKFEALLFDVGGLTLAVPLVALGHIVPLDVEKLTPLFGQSTWFMGLLPTPHGQFKTVNTALFVMPEKYDESIKENARYVISIDGKSWGLAVDSVNQPVTLSPEDVKWRSNRSKRAWLAGTIKERMCALLDVPQMAQILSKQDRSEPRQA